MRSIFACKKIPHRKFIFKCHPIFALKTEIRIISLSSGYKKKYYISRNTNDVFSYLVVESIGSSTAAISFSTGTITSILSLTFTEFMNILHSVHSFFDILESDSKKSRYVPVVDRTEPNLPNTEASVRFGRIQKYRTESFRCN